MKIGGYRIQLKNSYVNLFVPIFIAAVLAYYMISAWPIVHTDAMLLIRVLAAFITLSLVLIIKDEFIIQKADDAPVEKKPFFSSDQECMKFIGFVSLTCLYFIALFYIGFIISTLVYSIVAMYYLGVRSVLTLTLLPILFTGIIYTVFRVLLLVRLP